MTPQADRSHPVVAHRRRSNPTVATAGFRGVAIVEFAFVAIILSVMVAATVDYGRGWQSSLAVTEASRTGARVASGQANSPQADYVALTGIRAALQASNKIDDVELVVIYRATSASDGAVPASCIGASPSGTCNVFTKAQLLAINNNSFNITWAPNPNDPPTGGNGCPRSGNGYGGWCPTSRVRSPQGSADYLGVYVRFRHNNLFPVLGSGRTIARTAVMRVEPPSV